MMTLIDYVFVAAGGFFGAIIRYLLSQKLNTGKPIPYGTLIANTAGCLLVGIVMGLELSQPVTLLLAAGFAGALSTFSTWIKEGLSMMQKQRFWRASGYLLGSAAGGLVAVLAGVSIGSLF